MTPFNKQNIQGKVREPLNAFLSFTLAVALIVFIYGLFTLNA